LRRGGNPEAVPGDGTLQRWFRTIPPSPPCRRRRHPGLGLFPDPRGPGKFKEGLGFAYPLLFDMHDTRPERYSQAARHPEVVRAMQAAAARARGKFDPLRTQPAPPLVP
jgi:hypothetical protein